MYDVARRYAQSIYTYVHIYIYRCMCAYSYDLILKNWPNVTFVTLRNTDFWSFDALELAKAGSTTSQIAMHLLFINIYAANLLTAWLFAGFQAFLGDFVWCTLIS